MTNQSRSEVDDAIADYLFVYSDGSTRPRGILSSVSVTAIVTDTHDEYVEEDRLPVSYQEAGHV